MSMCQLHVCLFRIGTDSKLIHYYQLFEAKCCWFRWLDIKCSAYAHSKGGAVEHGAPWNFVIGVAGSSLTSTA